MKKILLLLAFTFISFYCINASNTKTSINGPTAKVELISSDIQTTIVRFSFDNFNTTTVQTQNGIAKSIHLNGAFPMQIANAPELLKISTSIIIPDDAEMGIEVISNSYKDYPDILIKPSKGNLYRNIDPSNIPFNFGSIYQLNAFFPGNLAELQQPYILRDYRGQTITVYPFQYNPVTKVLRVYKDLTVKVSRKGQSLVNTINRTKSLLRIDNEFKALYENHFLNGFTGNNKYTQVSEQGKMLIICYESFMAAMQPLVNWRNISGIPTQLVSVSITGSTTTAIKNYISNYYSTNGLTYVILVGDIAQIPTFTVSGGGSDNTYGYLTGNDHYPEIFVGRISAESITQVQTQVQKILAYEKTPAISNNWQNKGIGIGSDQGPGDNNEYDYQHIRNIRTKLLNYQYNACSELYDGSQGGLDATGNPTAAMVTTAVNNGAGIIYYTGHGSNTSWGTTGYSSTNITSLTNTSAWPFIFSVACVNGNFTTGTCFAESWMRATYNSQPTGAIATLMSTINQSWDPPMCGQDEMIDLLTESVSGNIKHSFGGISMNGCMKMNDNYTTSGYEMTDTWNIFGDPSLTVRTDTAKTMLVSHDTTILNGSTSFTVNCNVNNARVTLSINNQILATALVSNGQAILNFNTLTNLDTITVVATNYNYIPYIGKCLVIVPVGPNIQMNSKQIVDINGNNNSQADYNENITLNVDLKNAGNAIATNVSATLSTSDTNVIITNATHNWGNIAANAVSAQNNAFAITVKNFIPDQHLVNFNLTIIDTNSNIWNSAFTIILNAPVLNIAGMTIEDNPPANHNGKLDPAETVGIKFEIQNTGHSDISNLIINLSSPNTYINIPLSVANLTALTAGSNSDVQFSVSANSNVLNGANFALNINVNAGPYSKQQTYNSMIGSMVEDFETDNFTKYNWDTTVLNSWIISTIGEGYEGNYCSVSAPITHNQSSTLSIALNLLDNDSISFYRKVSSELNYDYLNFNIDGNLVDRWSGSMNWDKVSYPVTAGNHIFSWVYAKDQFASSGSDCAWLDFITLPAYYTTIGVGINDITAKNTVQLQVFPNPAVAMLSIIYNLSENSNVRLRIYTSDAQMIYQNEKKNQTAGSYTMDFDASMLSKGVYFISLQTNKQIVSRKIIITQ